jgi:hypothetical protein
VENTLTATFFNNPEGNFGGIRNRRSHFAQARNLGKILTGQRRVPITACEHNVLRITAATLLSNESYSLGFYSRAHCGVLQPFQNVVAAPSSAHAGSNADEMPVLDAV